MPFHIASAIVALCLFVALYFSFRQRSPMRFVIALLGLLFVLVATYFIPNPEAVRAQTTGVTVEDFGDAKFKSFSALYASFLGAPLSPAGQFDGILSQWFRYGLLQFKQDNDSPIHPEFKNITLAPLGQARLKSTELSIDQDAKIPDNIRHYLDSKERNDFYAGFTPIQPPSSGSSAPLVQNFGDAAFKDFYDKYAVILGEPVAPAGDYQGFTVQWFEFGRVELHTDYDGSFTSQPQFPKLLMGLIGQEYLQQKGVLPDPQPGIAPILVAWRAQKAFEQDLLYFYGNPLTNPKVDTATGFTTQYFQRAAYQWPNGATDPNKVTRLSIGLEVFNNLKKSGLVTTPEKARQDYINYFYGLPLTKPIPDKNAGLNTMYFTRAVFQWPIASTDPTDVRQLPIGADLYDGLTTRQISPWASPGKVLFLTLSAVSLIVSLVFALVLKRGGRVYGRV